MFLQQMQQFLLERLQPISVTSANERGRGVLPCPDLWQEPGQALPIFMDPARVRKQLMKKYNFYK